jgi:hypothetical protein
MIPPAPGVTEFILRLPHLRNIQCDPRENTSLTYSLLYADLVVYWRFVLAGLHYSTTDWYTSGLDCPESIPRRGIFSLLHSIETGSGVHPTCYPGGKANKA